MSLTAHDRKSTTRTDVIPQHRSPSRAAIGLTWLLTALVACASLTGLLVEGVYTGAESTVEMLRGYDLVTALVVLPSLAAAAHLARRGSVLAHLVVSSLVGYVVYTYAYYLFGTGFNDLFLLHAAVFWVGLVALGLMLASLDLAALADYFGPRTRVRTIAVILGLLAAALGGMWIYLAVDNAVTGDVPTGSRLVETDTVVHLGMALDLALLVPLYAAAAALLWRRTPGGYALAGLALFAGILHQLCYVVAMPFQVAADVPGSVSFDPGEPIIVLLYLTASVLLLLGARTRVGSSRLQGARGLRAPTSRPSWNRRLWAVAAAMEAAAASVAVVLDLLIPTLVLLAMAALSLLLRRRGLGSLGLHRIAEGSLVVKMLVFAVVWSLFQLGVTMPVANHVSGEKPDLSAFEGLEGNIGMLVAYLVLGWTLAALGEEIAYRGYLLTRVREALGGGRPALVVAVLVSSLLFGVAHSEQGLIGVFVITLDALAWSALRLHYKTLWASILAHGFNNTLGFITFFLLGPVYGLW